jgi:hypothetical protein
VNLIPHKSKRTQIEEGSGEEGIGQESEEELTLADDAAML